ncbi:DUF4114 domain-containing protein [Myxosarcina sp. GI1]|uniref:DUF4114 domain-containing protein n=1 Tax=Myxosarcina sp. GI1 TaxID=1541065 RepID=UPI00056A69A3|nr:DUF4114 domain-containing protein [Myxosarcina sp. GI1]
MTTINNYTNGIFTVNSDGKVTVDYLYDGGWYRGELAIFSLEGMETLEVGSTEFLQEAANRALTNSEAGYVVLNDKTDLARFQNLNGGTAYKGAQSFQMRASDRFAMMLVVNGTVEDLAANRYVQDVFFSFDTGENSNGQTFGQIADLTGDGHTFGWEDINISNTEKVDRDYNDIVVQVEGATTTSATFEDLIDVNRDWLDTEVGQELLTYTSRPQFESGTFIVNSTGRVEFDYLYDGGWYQGELAVFSLKGMEAYESGSIEFLTEAANRALSNSEKGRILIKDSSEGALFSDTVTWEKDFNSDAEGYQGVGSFEMEAGDELAFMLVQHTTFQDIYQHPYSTSQWGKKVLFSTDENQIAAVDNNGTLAFEDIVIESGNSDYDYNDFVFQVNGLESDNTVSMDDVVNANRDWRNTGTGVNLLTYANRTSFNEGVFEVGETGEITFDYLYDGGWFQGELAVFSLSGMDIYDPGSDNFIAEATRRALTNSELGYVLANDRNEGAKFTQKMAWENNFNKDPDSYQGVRSFTMTPGDKFAFMLVQNTTVWEITDPSQVGQWGKVPIFSTPEANPKYAEAGLIVDVDGNGTYAFEDVLVGGDRDYNDFIFQVKGAKGAVAAMDNYINSDRDWRSTSIGQELLEYANRATFDEGIFRVGDSGEVKINFLYDGGHYSGGEVGIFSLSSMDIYEVGSEAFIAEALARVTSNSTQGYIIASDADEGARFSGNLNWEKNYNTDSSNYRGQQSFQMNPNDDFGMVLIPGSSFEEAKTAPDWATKKQPLFSMAAANHNSQVQIAEVLTGAEGTIISFEDIRRDLGSNIDYNDFVIAIEGVEGIGITEIEDVMASNRNWLETTVGNDVFNYSFDDVLGV